MENTLPELPVDSKGTAGEPLKPKSRILEAGASVIQAFAPVKQICAHLNAFHAYASDPKRSVEADHYCTHLTEDIRQRLIYDSPHSNARLIGVEYMVSPRIFQRLPQEERRLWHSHHYEIKSGMLIMPSPAGMPDLAWEAAEKSEMRDLMTVYGKTYHFWQVDRGDPVPMGPPELMASFISDETVRNAKPGGLKELLTDRDQRYGVNFEDKQEKRKDVEPVEKHPDVDAMWSGPVTRVVMA